MVKVGYGELSELEFGTKIRVVWSKNESYIGIIFGNKIGYTDDKVDDISVIDEHMVRELCEVYIIE